MPRAAADATTVGAGAAAAGEGAAGAGAAAAGAGAAVVDAAAAGGAAALAAAPAAPAALPAGGDTALQARPGLANPYVAPRDDEERRMAALWERLMGVGPVGAHDNFFELGGHSLLAVQLASCLREELQAEIALAELLAQPTVAGMVAAVGRRGTPQRAAVAAPELPALVPDPEHRHEPFPLTDVQQAYWLGRHAEFGLGNVATHNYLEIDFRQLDLGRLGRAWQRLVERHDMLRAIVLPHGEQQILAATPAYRIATVDLSRCPAATAESALAGVRQKMSHQVLPSDRWPLFELRAALAGGRTRLYVSFDLLIGDAWSWQILIGELARLYADPAAELAPLALSFRDYVLAEIAWRETAEYRRAAAYWQGRLASLPAAPELPLTKQLAAVERPRFERRASRLDAAAWSALKQRGVAAGLTPSGVVLAAFCEVLAAWSRVPRLTLNLTLFQRLPLHPQVNSLVGDFTSLNLLAVEPPAQAVFEQRARAIQERLWRDLDHRTFSGVRVLRELARGRGDAGAVAMPVVFTSTLTMAGAPSAALPGEAGYGISQTPQVLLDHQVGEHGGALVYNWDAVEELFPAGLLDAMFAAYGGLLERLAA
ncbi:MAG TPA: condensation domain-containing protein, partial [Thermoanaerobaculia bacterium]